MDLKYRVYASERATVGNYTFYLILKIGDYQTRVPVEACVVEEMPPAPPRTPWFVSLMIPLSFVFFFALVYLGYQLVKGAIDRLRGC